MLDKKDRDLLCALDLDARAPYARLAKTIRMSKQGTEYKLKTLQRKGVIEGFYPVINVPQLGYLYCRLLITFQGMTREQHEHTIRALKAHRKVFWLFRMQGPYDLLLVIWAKSVTEFKEFTQSLYDSFGQHIKIANQTIATDVIHLPHTYLGGKKRDPVHLAETNERARVDDTDLRILRALCNDARASLVRVASSVGETVKVVSYRIRKMERIGLIKAYRPILNHALLGYTYLKILINARGTKESLARLKSYIQQQPIVIYIVEGTGLPADLDIEIMVRTNAELSLFIDDLRFRFPTVVGEYQVVTFLETLKVRYLPE